MSDQLEKLSELSKKYLNEKGQADINQLILDERLDLVRAYLLGAIEGLHAKQKISDAEANEVIGVLALSQEERATISTGNKVQ